jgi:hypothetical protein
VLDSRTLLKCAASLSNRICNIQSCGSVTFLVRIRIRGSVQLSYGFGFGSGSCSFRQWLARCQKNIFSAFYFLNVYLHQSSKTKVLKKPKNSKNLDFSYYFAWWWKDPDPYLWLMHPDPGGPKTNGSGSTTLETSYAKTSGLWTAVLGCGSRIQLGQWIRTQEVKMTTKKREILHHFKRPEFIFQLKCFQQKKLGWTCWKYCKNEYLTFQCPLLRPRLMML